MTTLAQRLGPSASGMDRCVNYRTAGYRVITHAQQGAGAAAAFLCTFIVGMWSAVAFSSTITLAIVPLGTRLSFPIAIGVTVAVQTIVLWTLSMGSRRGCDARSRHVCGMRS